MSKSSTDQKFRAAQAIIGRVTEPHVVKEIVAWSRYRGNLLKLAAVRWRVERRFASLDSRARRHGKSQADLSKLGEIKAQELSAINEKMAIAEFSYLASQASRLRVPAPDRLDAGCWYISTQTGRRCLTDKALAEFRAEIQRAKDDRWQFWQSD
jgi:hypothetical protein